MRRTGRSGPALAALALLLSGCGAGAGADAAADDPAGSDVPGGSDVPAALGFSAETVAGEELRGADLAGKPSVFWFWAPWCPTCHAQIAGVEDLAAAHGDDVHVVGVGALDERAAIEEFAAEVSPDVTLLADPDGEVWRHFEVTAQSTYVVLDETGATVARGHLDDAELAATVEDLVG